MSDKRHYIYIETKDDSTFLIEAMQVKTKQNNIFEALKGKKKIYQPGKLNQANIPLKNERETKNFSDVIVGIHHQISCNTRNIKGITSSVSTMEQNGKLSMNKEPQKQ